MPVRGATRTGRGRSRPRYLCRAALAAIFGCSLLASCGTETASDGTAAAAVASPGSRLETLLEPVDEDGFERALTHRAFEFPRDHGPHPDFRHEWWYFTGHLDATNGERFGYELTFFRYAFAPPRQRPREGSPWRSQQIYVAHFAITDIGAGRFHSVERRDRDALELAGARPSPPRVWLQNWTFDATGVQWRLAAGDDTYTLKLMLTPATAPVLNGVHGLSRKSSEPAAASYYYSIPRIATRGELERGTQRLGVEGNTWFDREWGSGALASDQEGWDWFALQLDDGSALMFHALRKRGGARDPFSAGTWIEPDGTARGLKSAEVAIEVLEHWRSPRGGSYPARWRLRLPDLGLDLDLEPVLADQELDTTPRYWEGAVDVSGTRDSRQLSGRGYVELTGYARSP